MSFSFRRSANLNMRAALQALWQNRLRSSLTVLGVVIGVASAILLIAISEGAQRRQADPAAAGPQ